jgi:hypothetical protein
MGSQSMQVIPQFNQLSNMITNLTHSVSNKLGLAVSHGYKTYNNAASTNNHADGAVHLPNAEGNVGGPLRCMLSEATKLVPLALLPNVRIQLTLASLATVFTDEFLSTQILPDSNGDYFEGDLEQKFQNVANGKIEQPVIRRPSDFTISNMQLSYNAMSFPTEVVETLRMQPQILIKTQGFSTTSQSIPKGTSGVVENVYNSRYASIKSLFLLNSSNSTNGIFDSFNISPKASYQFYVNGQQYPSLPITKDRNAYIELLKACGSAFDTIGNNFAINQNEYNYELRDLNLDSTSAFKVPTLSEPAKFYVGCRTQIASFTDRMISGVSSENSSLSVRMNIEEPTPRPVTSSLVVNYDMIIQIDPMTRSALIKM